MLHKIDKNKKVAPKLIFFNENFFRKILALFDSYFWPFNKSHEKINTIFVISAIIASIWNVFIKFRWHDEKLTDDIKYPLVTYPTFQVGFILLLSAIWWRLPQRQNPKSHGRQNYFWRMCGQKIAWLWSQKALAAGELLYILLIFYA